MKRRNFLSTTAGLAAAALSGTASAQPRPEVRWRLASSYPKSRDILYGASERLARRVLQLTDGRFAIEASGSGERVPGLQALDAVRDGRIELCHSSANFYIGMDPAFAFGTGLPFGPNARLQSAWLLCGGGGPLFEEFCHSFQLHPILCGSTGAKMGGWFRKELRGISDLNGLKIRIGGMGAYILSKFGAVPQSVSGSALYTALESGSIDAADWLSPYDDEKLGLNRVSPFYHYPGWWEGGSNLHLFVNLDSWNRLPRAYQAALEAAASESGAWLQAAYDVENPPALSRLIRSGTQFRPFPQEIMEACFRQAQDLFAAIAQSNEPFRRMLDSLTAYRADAYLWWQVAEYSYDTFESRERPKTR
jgi:TRAP-type mannitol/chloroaromatic compound transport system substrate-binding protein